MTLAEKYKHLDIFKPYFLLWLNLTYDEKGEPWIIRALDDFIADSGKHEFRKSILDIHRDTIEINHDILDIQKRYFNIWQKLMFR